MSNIWFSLIDMIITKAPNFIKSRNYAKRHVLRVVSDNSRSLQDFTKSCIISAVKFYPSFWGYWQCALQCKGGCTCACVLFSAPYLFSFSLRSLVPHRPNATGCTTWCTAWCTVHSTKNGTRKTRGCQTVFCRTKGYHETLLGVLWAS